MDQYQYDMINISVYGTYIKHPPLLHSAETYAECDFQMEDKWQIQQVAY